MDRTHGLGHVDNRFVHEDANTGQPPTELTAEWFNTVQEELVAVVLDAGLVLDSSNNAQLLEALNKIIVARRGQIALLSDSNPSGTLGGTCTAAVTATRRLNTVDFNGIAGLSLSANTITLPAGTYKIHARAPCYANGHRLLIYNLTDSVFITTGANAEAAPTAFVITDAALDNVFTLSATKVIDIRHYASETIALYGYGVALSQGFPEIYLTVVLEKLR